MSKTAVIEGPAPIGTKKSAHVRYAGTVEWFNLGKGVGVIRLEGGQGVRVSWKDVATDGTAFKSLTAGDQVSFSLRKLTKPEYGLTHRAVEVKVSLPAPTGPAREDNFV